MGLLGTTGFLGPPFFVCSASRKGRFRQLLTGAGRGGSLGQGPGLPQRTHRTISLSSSAELKPPTNGRGQLLMKFNYLLPERRSRARTSRTTRPRPGMPDTSFEEEHKLATSLRRVCVPPPTPQTPSCPSPERPPSLGPQLPAGQSNKSCAFLLRPKLGLRVSNSDRGQISATRVSLDTVFCLAHLKNKTKQTKRNSSSCCGATGSVASWERWDTGSTRPGTVG